MGFSPAFSFYARDFLTGTSTMSLAEVGAYIKLLAYQWDVGSVPKCPKERTRILGCSTRQERSIWSRLASKFTLVGDGYQNKRLEDERLKQIERRRRLSDNGSKGAESKWQGHKHIDGKANGPANSQPMAAPLANGRQDDGLAFAFASSSNNKEQYTVPPAPAKSLISGQASPRDWGRIHGNHESGFCDWVCLPDFLFAEFIGKSGKGDAAQAYVRTWAKAIREKWASCVIGEDGLKFWRTRWAESHASADAHKRINIQDILDKEAARKAEKTV